ncbi:MAG TPA: TIGR02281 family clan AA aspartic protease [Xanthobacteraceae bacterium]|nr:TIGR02281 family clan AA aspartic protease [Xanthobacteraceae bacterium]
MLRSVLIIAGATIAVALFAPDLAGRYFERRPTAPAPRAMSVAPPKQADYAGSIHIPADRFGHFQAEVQVNGRPLDALVDTGASFVVLRFEDAQSLGVVYAGDPFDIPAQTANGVGHVRRVKLSSVRVGSIQLDDVDAVVAEEGTLARNLLGMSFLRRLSRYEVRDDTLILGR